MDAGLDGVEGAGLRIVNTVNLWGSAGREPRPAQFDVPDTMTACSETLA